MKRNILLALLICLFCMSVCAGVDAKPKYFSDDSGKKKVAPDPIYNKTIIIPQGYVLSIRTNNVWSTKNFTVPDKVFAHLNDDFYYNNHLIAPQGSIVQGMVVKSVSANEQQDAQLQIKFTSIITPNAQVIPITALVKNGDKNGIIKGNKEISQNSLVDIILKQPVTYIPL